ncbi:hypothetical protein ACNYDD_21990, partial [Phocaeicola vulgatus]|uniref:hypothetical protein n=1 Tax=Phocaeicola vulgatus TaxID=821 RepID=UPI003AB3A4B7
GKAGLLPYPIYLTGGNKWHGCSNFLFPVQIKAVIITLQWICRRLTVCFIICHHVAWPVDSTTRLSKAAM